MTWRRLRAVRIALSLAFALSHHSNLLNTIIVHAAMADTKFWVTDDGKKNPDDMAGLPHFFNEMVDYIAAMKGTDPMRTR